jgi:hypothetical protein
MRWRQLLQLGASCLICTCLQSMGPVVALASAPASARTLLAAVLAAVRAQEGARWEGTISLGSMPAVSSASSVLAGTASGTATSTYTETNGTKSRTFHGQLILADGTVFFKGDAGAWYFEMGVMGGPAVTEADRWVAISSKCTSKTRQECRLFERLASGLTVSTAMSPVAMTGTLSLLSPTTIHGQHVVGVKGMTANDVRTPSVSEVLYVREGGSPLPVEAVQAAVPNGAGPWTFRYQWSKVTPVRPPSSSVPFDPRWLGSA